MTWSGIFWKDYPGCSLFRRDHREQWRRLNRQGAIEVTQARSNSGLNQSGSNENCCGKESQIPEDSVEEFQVLRRAGT